MKKYLLVFIPTIFLFACGTVLNSEKNPDSSSTDDVNSEDRKTFFELFLKDKSIAKFKGEGNEFATFSLTTHYLYDDFVVTYEDNGGTVVQKIYRIHEDKISLIANRPEAYDREPPTLSELNSMQEIEVYMASPLEVGTEFDGWKITSTTDTVETELRTFDHVIVIGKKDIQGASIKKYFVKNYGEIKREYILQDGDELFKVTSTIESIK